MTNDIFVFDINTVAKKKNRLASYITDYNFLFELSLDHIVDRLGVIKKKYPIVLQIGNRAQTTKLEKFGIEKIIALDNAYKLKPNIIGNEELLPFKSNSFDLTISPLNLHSTNDLPGALSQIRNCLKPNGLFIAAMFGGETLYELRQIMNEVEIEQTGGISPRISPFADLAQMSSLMQRAGFNLPVIDSEKITVTYDNIFKLMEDLRFMGEGNSIKSRKKSFTSRRFFSEVNTRYKEVFSEEDGRIKATFEIIFLLGWKPHESQQKPLRPGSAKMRLADALQTNEGKLPC